MIVLQLLVALGGQGASWIEPPTLTDGVVHARIKLDEGGALDSLRLVANSTSLKTTAAEADSRGSTTLLSIDASGSFRKHYAKALELAASLHPLVGPKRGIGLMVFGRRSRTWSPTNDPALFAAQLEQARAGEAVQPETRLAAFLLEGIDRVAAARPVAEGGVRRLIVFTDAGEESDIFQPADVVEHAHSRRVRIDIVVFARDKARSYAKDLDRISLIARQTGGSVIEVYAHQIAPTAVSDLLTAGSGLVDLSAPLCGTGQPEINIVGSAGIRTDALALRGDLLPCTPGPRSSHWPAQPSSTTVKGAPPARRPPSKIVGLLCLLLTLASFLGLGGVAIWFARRNTEPEEPAAAQPLPIRMDPPKADVLPPEPTPKTERSKGFSMKLPERHLVVLAGDLPVGTRWRFTGRILRIGATPEDNDVVVNLSQVSGTHARFELFPTGAIFIEDLGSSNGTFIDGVRISPGERMELPEGASVALSSQLTVAITTPQRADAHPKDES